MGNQCLWWTKVVFPAGYNSKFDLVERKNRTGPNNLLKCYFQVQTDYLVCILCSPGFGFQGLLKDFFEAERQLETSYSWSREACLRYASLWVLYTYFIPFNNSANVQVVRKSPSNFFKYCSYSSCWEWGALSEYYCKN